MAKTQDRVISTLTQLNRNLRDLLIKIGSPDTTLLSIPTILEIHLTLMKDDLERALHLTHELKKEIRRAEARVSCLLSVRSGGFRCDTKEVG